MIVRLTLCMPGRACHYDLGMPSVPEAWIPSTDQSPRRRRKRESKAADWVGGLVIVGAICTGLGILCGFAGTKAFQPWAAVAGAALGIVLWAWILIASLRSLRVKYGWARARSEGWSLTPPRSWAWDAGRVSPVLVRFAQSTVRRGYPVTLLSVEWRYGGLGALGATVAGQGLVIVVELPEDYGPAGVVLRQPPDNHAKDPFDRAYNTVDSPRLALGEDSRLRAAYVAGGRPPWIIDGKELYAFVSSSKIPRPSEAATLIGSTLDILDLLGIPAPQATPSVEAAATDHP